MKSILQTNWNVCFKKGCRCEPTHTHEVMYGSANRKKSIKYGLQIHLCPEHHNMSNKGIHFDPEFDLETKKYAQEKFEQLYSHDKWMELFKKSYTQDIRPLEPIQYLDLSKDILPF